MVVHTVQVRTLTDSLFTFADDPANGKYDGLMALQAIRKHETVKGNATTTGMEGTTPFVIPYHAIAFALVSTATQEDPEPPVDETCQ